MDPVSKEAAGASLSLLSRIINYLLVPKTRTIASTVAPLRVTPHYLVEQSVRDYENFKEVTKFASNVFTAHYLMMLSALQTSINGVRVIDELNKLNPKMVQGLGVSQHKECFDLAIEAFATEATGAGASTHNALREQREAEKHEMAKARDAREQERQDREEQRRIDKEARDQARQDREEARRDAKEERDIADKEKQERERIIKEERELAEKAEKDQRRGTSGKQVTDFDASYGRVLEVDMKIAGDAQKAYVMIGLLPSVLQDRDIFDIMKVTKKDRGFLASWGEWRSGGKTFWEFLSGSDVNREFRNIAKRDRSGYLQAVLNQYLNNRMTLQDSFANDSSVLVISKDTVRRMKAVLGIDITASAKRDDLLSSLFALMVIVVDTDTDDIDFYLSGFPRAVSLNIREIKGKNKGDGVDVMSIMGALQKGSVPRF